MNHSSLRDTGSLLLVVLNQLPQEAVPILGHVGQVIDQAVDPAAWILPGPRAGPSGLPGVARSGPVPSARGHPVVPGPFGARAYACCPGILPPATVRRRRG